MYALLTAQDSCRVTNPLRIAESVVGPVQGQSEGSIPPFLQQRRWNWLHRDPPWQMDTLETKKPSEFPHRAVICLAQQMFAGATANERDSSWGVPSRSSSDDPSRGISDLRVAEIE